MKSAIFGQLIMIVFIPSLYLVLKEDVQTYGDDF
jgi:hypothetical protein